MLRDAGGASVFLDDAFDRTGSETAVVAGSVGGTEVLAVIKEERGEPIGAGVEIVADAVGGGLGDENWAVFAAFSAD